MNLRNFSIARLRKLLVLMAEGFILIIKMLFRKKKRMIYLFGSPNHSNLGDQAQTYCIECWCKRYLSEYGLFVFINSLFISISIILLRKIINKEDILFCHSGYHITDLYNEKKTYCKVIELFPDYPITIFPQTIHFINKDEEKKIVGIFNKHPNLTLLCRDAVSYENAKKLFTYAKLLLYPDIVTSLIGNYSFSNTRSGVLLCKRNDKESFYTKGEIQELIERFSNITKIEVTDTTVSISYRYIRKRRKEILESIFNEYSKYKVVITDRYHGTIFSLIAGTPVIVLQSTDHKLSSGVDWFPKELFGNYITVAENLDMAFSLAIDRINHQIDKPLPCYFKEKYYDILLNKLSLGK